MSTSRSQLIDLIEQGCIPADAIDSALGVLGVRPAGRNWRVFVDQLLLWLGGLALGFAVLFFIAYNWQDLGRFAKFGMVEAVIALAVLGYCKLADNSASGKVSLLVAAIALGVLLALYGQTYQTGADPWQLFFNWALLMLPWAVIGRFAAIWILWVALINVSLMLYFQTFRGFFGFVFSSNSSLLWALFIFNTTALVAWQLLAKHWHWLAQSWAIRLLAVGSGASITWLAMYSIFDSREFAAIPAIVWALWLAVMYYAYRKIKLDLFMLAGSCLSAISVIASFFAEHILNHNDAGSFLVLAFIVIAMGGGAALWLKHLHRESLS